jgi:membrane-bound lytic murein transglycosylase D
MLINSTLMTLVVCALAAASWAERPSSPVPRSEHYSNLGVILNPWAEDQINFWKKIYTQYSSNQAVIHDSMNLNIVYSVVGSQPKQIENEKKRIRKLLKSISHKNAIETLLTAEELKIFQSHGSNTDPRVYDFSSENDRIRSQIGQSNRTENAFSISRHYLKRMEEMFAEEGVPRELTRLPFVESSFQTTASSSVGALGIWQFMPKTAMKDLKVTSVIDERRDPLKSTRAAARYLRSNYKSLKNWSLAVMAYHHGSSLVRKAMKRLSTNDPILILRTFKDPSFKFASRNYLFELLAMLDVDAERSSSVQLEATNSTNRLPLFITVSFQKKMKVSEILKALQLNQAENQAAMKTEFKMLNPQFLDPIWKETSAIPAHYPVRISRITLEDFRKAFP